MYEREGFIRLISAAVAGASSSASTSSVFLRRLNINRRLARLPDATRVFVGHDYQPGGRALAFESTIGDQRRQNIQLPAERSEADFVAFRQARDSGLAAPKLLYPSLQVNINAGHLPAPARADGPLHLKIPVHVKAAKQGTTGLT